MKDLGDFSAWIDKLTENIDKECYHAMELSVDEQKASTLERIEIPQEARNTAQFVAYSQSIENRVEQDGDTIRGSVYSELLVGGDDPKWADVPVGMFLECGTGELGFRTNTYDHGYDYTLHVWDFHTWLQQLQTGTFGIRARPHVIPAFNEEIPKFKENIRKAVYDAWTKSVS